MKIDIDEMLKSVENTYGGHWMIRGDIDTIISINGQTVNTYIKKSLDNGIEFESKSEFFKTGSIKRKLYNFKEILTHAYQSSENIIWLNDEYQSLQNEKMRLNDIKEELRNVRQEIRSRKSRLDSLKSRQIVENILLKNTGNYFAQHSEVIRHAIDINDFTTCGIYFLIDSKKRNVVYVGQSINVAGRIQQHINDPNKMFDKYTYISCKEHHLNTMESIYVHVFNPIYNKRAPRNLDSICRDLLAIEDERIKLKNGITSLTG